MNMRNVSRLLWALPVLLVSFISMAIPAQAWPPCVVEVRIRCNGGTINQYGPITGYDSPEECAAAEVPMRCNVPYDPEEWAFVMRAEDAAV